MTTLRLVEDDEESLEDLTLRAHQIDQEFKALKRESEAVNRELMQRLTDARSRAHTMPYTDGKRLRVVRVANARMSVDESGLRKELGARLFNTITVRKVDLEQLNVAVMEGRIKKEEVSAYVSTNEHPYVRFYVLEGEGDEPAGDTGDE
jgi:hypothetical protein